MMKLIYSPEKKKIWDEEMAKAGERWESDEIEFDEYMKIRTKLRKRLGYPN